MKTLAIIFFLILGFICSDCVGQDWNRNYNYGNYYYPQVVWVPQGTQLSVTARVSQDRRYVRIGTDVRFTHIPQVYTFNYVTGRYEKRR